MLEVNYRFHIIIKAFVPNTDKEYVVFDFVEDMHNTLLSYLKKQISFKSLPTKCKVVSIEKDGIE